MSRSTLIGGGAALLRAKKAIGKITSDNPDVQAGINIVLKAVEAPLRQIAENSGVEGSIVVSKVMESKSETFGFDAQNEEYVDLVEKGIIDPAKVVRRALQDAASVAGLLVTTEAMVAELPKEKPAIQQLLASGLIDCAQSSAEAASDNSPWPWSNAPWLRPTPRKLNRSTEKFRCTKA